MSKNKLQKRRKQSSSSFAGYSSTSSIAALSGHGLEDEYRIIKHDLLRVLIVNAIFLAAVFALYYTNVNSHYLERWFSQIVKF